MTSAAGVDSAEQGWMGALRPELRLSFAGQNWFHCFSQSSDLESGTPQPMIEQWQGDDLAPAYKQKSCYWSRSFNLAECKIDITNNFRYNFAS